MILYGKYIHIIYLGKEVLFMLSKLEKFNFEHRKLLLLILTVSAIAITEFSNPSVLSYINFVILSISWMYEIYYYFTSSPDEDQ